VLAPATQYSTGRIASRSEHLIDSTAKHLPAFHTIYFWTNPTEDLRQVARVLKPGARFVLGFRPRDEKTSTIFPENIYRHYAPDEVRTLLEESGFEDVQIESRRISGRTICVSAGSRVERCPTITSEPTTRPESPDPLHTDE
jgi:SAM-dependent methyltransferase